MKGFGELYKSKKKSQKANHYRDQLINIAFKFHSEGNISEASKYYQLFIDQGFKDHRVFSNYGLILKDMGNLKKAELTTRKAIELNPNFAYAYSNLGNILTDIGKLQEAELSYRKAIELNPNFAMAHSNLGSILMEIGDLKEAERFTLKAIELDPHNQTTRDNYISLLTIHKPDRIKPNKICLINEEFKELNLSYKENSLITNDEAIKIYQDGLRIYKKYNLNFEVDFSQIYKRNEVNLNCKRHKLIFNEHKIIPEFCFGCYKVQIEVGSIIELIKLFLVFNNLKLENNNTRKSLIETRPNISGFYKGLIYCLDLNEALEISKELNIHIQNHIRTNLISKVKRGCSEYPLVFPKYKEIKLSGNQPMNYNDNWKSIEKEFDKDNKNWGKSSKSIEGFNLNDFLIMRNWIAYAQTIRDESVNKITNEQIKKPKFLQNLNREFHAMKS